MTFTSIIFLALAALTCCQFAHAQNYVAEGYFVVENKALDIYIKEVSGSTSPITRRATAVNNLKKDIDYLLTAVNELYSSLKSDGLNVEIQIRDLKILDTNVLSSSSLISGEHIDATKALDTFESWIVTDNLHTRLNYDFAILWTGYDLQDKGNEHTTGFAHVGEICNPKLSIGVVEFNATYMTAAVTAHEIGHILGAHHDGDKSEYIMHATTGPAHTKRWYFSTRSINSFKDTIATLDSNCLLSTNSATRNPQVSWSSYDGKMLDPNVNCQRRVNDANSYLCMSPSLYGNVTAKGDVVCQHIQCQKPDTDLCFGAHTPEWMVCDAKKRCEKGKCVVDPAAPAPGVDANCVFGDQKQLELINPDFSGTCQDYINQNGVVLCYSDTMNQDLCCGTCSKYNTGRQSCLYGDKSKECGDYPRSATCPTNMAVCCDYCHGFVSKRSVKDDKFQVVLAEDDVNINLTPKKVVKESFFKQSKGQVAH